MTTHAIVESQIKVGQKFEQINEVPDSKHPGKFLKIKRVIEILGVATLSSPVNYRILRNDAHPHREGKAASIRVADLRRKYEAV